MGHGAKCISYCRLQSEFESHGFGHGWVYWLGPWLLRATWATAGAHPKPASSSCLPKRLGGGMGRENEVWWTT